MAEKTFSPGTALYYPYIHPRDLGHIKAALLYWDRIRRIVPRSVTSGGYVYDDDEDTRILAEHKLLLATKPEPYEQRAAQRFFEHVEPQSERFRIDLNAARELAKRNRGIHIEKFGSVVLDRLDELGLAHRFGDWVTMRDEVGAFYMFCLASEMATQMDAPLFTDSIADASLGQSLLFEASEPAPPTNVSDVLIRLQLKLPTPEELQHVSIKKITKFVKHRSGERQRFREAIEGVLDTVRSATDPNAVEDYLDSQQSKINEAVSDLHSTLDEIRVSGVNSAASITVPAAAAVAIAAFPVSATAAAILAATGIVVSAISCFAETRGKLREARSSSPYHYLISVEKAFS